MRLPPAKGFAGSAVWQLVQSPASTSPLPCAMVSSEGSAFAWPAASALHKMRGARIARIAGHIQLMVGKGIARKDGVTLFRRHASGRHKPKLDAAIDGTKLRFAKTACSYRDFVMRRPEKPT